MVGVRPSALLLWMVSVTEGYILPPAMRCSRLSRNCAASTWMSSSQKDDASLSRRDLGQVVLGGFAFGSITKISPVGAQRPPPRPKVTSIPQECLQAGGCGMVGTDENFPKFKTIDAKPEVLDPKSGRYSSGLKIQEISAGDEKGLAVADGRTVSLQVPKIFLRLRKCRAK
jgi:hypothetical protein